MDTEESSDVDGTTGGEQADPTAPVDLLPARLRRPTRFQVVALVVVVLLSLAPIGALVTVVRSDTGPSRMLLDGPPPPADGAQLQVTVTDVVASTGEMRARLVLQPQADLLDEQGRLLRDLELRVNDVAGSTVHRFASGQSPYPVDVTVALGGGSVARYPFDSYRGALSVVLASVEDEKPDPVPFSVDVLSTEDLFRVSTARELSLIGEPSPLAIVSLAASRRPTTVVYVLWSALLMWALALGGAAVVWTATIWRSEVPMWAFGYLVGVLFALPQVRQQLPGAPPPGALFDFVAFYWCLAIVAVSLVTLLLTWVQRERALRRASRG